MSPATEPEPGVGHVTVPATAAEQIAAYHAMRSPRNPSEHLAAAALLGLELKELAMVIQSNGEAHRTGPTLRDRIARCWRREQPPTTTPPGLRPAPSEPAWRTRQRQRL